MKIGKLLTNHVLAPLVSTIATKVGEAIGDRLAYLINPPEPEECPHPVWLAADDERVCLRCGEREPLDQPGDESN